MFGWSFWHLMIPQLQEGSKLRSLHKTMITCTGVYVTSPLRDLQGFHSKACSDLEPGQY